MRKILLVLTVYDNDNFQALYSEVRISLKSFVDNFKFNYSIFQKLNLIVFCIEDFFYLVYKY